ncbi:MAG TPA: hypothetical protein VGM23_02440, partial [Armatimonadota bacterium]
MQKLLTLGMVAMLALAGAAYAYPSLSGPTGFGVLPDAAVATGFEAAADFYNTADSFALNSSLNFETPDAYPIRVVFGAGQNFEIGGGYELMEDNNIWSVNAKYALPIELAGAKLAVGAQYWNMTDTDGTQYQIYAVGDIPVGEKAK